MIKASKENIRIAFVFYILGLKGFYKAPGWNSFLLLVEVRVYVDDNDHGGDCDHVPDHADFGEILHSLMSNWMAENNIVKT